MTKWMCSRCGGSNVQVSAARPSIDDRFAVGYCDRCTPEPLFDPRTQKYKPVVRATVALAPDSDKTRDAINARDRAVAERKLVEKALAGDARLTQAQRDEAAAIRRRWDSEAEARRSA